MRGIVRLLPWPLPLGVAAAVLLLLAERGDIPETTRRRGAASDELLTSAEVAELFGVDRRTVVLWAKRGRLPALRTPGGQHRFRAGEIRKLLDKNRDANGGDRVTGRTAVSPATC